MEREVCSPVPRRHWHVSLWQSLAAHQFYTGRDRPLPATKLICSLFQLFRFHTLWPCSFLSSASKASNPIWAAQANPHQRANMHHTQRHLLCYCEHKNLKGKRMATAFLDGQRLFTKLHKYMLNGLGGKQAWQIFLTLFFFNEMPLSLNWSLFSLSTQQALIFLQDSAPENGEPRYLSSFKFYQSECNFYDAFLATFWIKLHWFVST